MTSDLKLKPGWLARDVAAAAEQVKKLKTPLQPRLCDCERGHNGLGIMGRECDCDPENPQQGD